MNVITNPVANIPINEKSHTLGWTKVWASHLSADINHKCTSDILNYDKVFVDFGANYSGSLNLFGGANQELFERLNLIMQCKNVASLDWPFELSQSLRKRINAKTTYEGFNDEWFDKLEEFEKNVDVIKQEKFAHSDGITLGDSHTIAFSRDSDVVLRNDGKTLFGALRYGLKNMFREMDISGDITLCFGSIDIRHHFLRDSNWSDNVTNLIAKYIKQGTELEKEYSCNVSY